MRFLNCLFILSFSLVILPVGAQAQNLAIAASHANGVYSPGEPIVWTVSVTGDNASQVRSAHYLIRKGGGVTLSDGNLGLSTGSAQVTTAQTEPLSYLLEVTAVSTGQTKPLRADGGAVVAPEQIQPSMTRPADFDAFWTRKLADLDAVSPNPVVETGDSGRLGVHYETVTMDNVGGAKVHAQIARPERDGKFPALIVMQYAGVYGLKKETVTNPAARGWLAVDIMAHDLPLNHPDSFYETAGKTTLKNYTAIGNDNRETSYFFKMILGCVRVAKYLMTRPDWNGTTIVAVGTSQGGFQAIALTALVPQVNAVLVLVPAGCDQTGDAAGRAVPWPYWIKSATPQNHDALREASRYYDAMNFASRIHVPALVGIGLIDRTSTPSGDFAAVNQMAGPKETVILPFSGHHGTHNTQAAFHARESQWLKALQAGHAPPIVSGAH